MTAGSLSCEALAGLAAVTVVTFRVAPRTPTPALAACMKRGQAKKYRDLVRRIPAQSIRRVPDPHTGSGSIRRNAR